MYGSAGRLASVAGRTLAIVVATMLLAYGSAGSAAAAGPEATRKALAEQMRPAGKASGAYVVDLDTGERVFARRPKRRRVPASVNKLFTTATALLRFGRAATLSTTILSDAPVGTDGVLRGNLYLRGGGDPTLTTRRLEAAAADLAFKLGLWRVTGRVIGDESAFDDRRGPPSSRYAVSSWVGPLSALSLDRGRTGRRRPYWQADPPRFAAKSFARALKRAGVATKVKRARAGTVPEPATEVFVLRSPSMSTLARMANVPSDNFVAEQLVKAIGSRFGAAGTTAGGAAAVRSTLRPLGVRPQVADGSGLSRSNRVSPRHVVRLLDAILDTPAAEPFAASLAVAGRSGTLRKRMRRSRARDRCRAKTGTLHAISALAGYCTSAGGSRLAFAILQNGVDTYYAKRREDRMLEALASYSPAG